MDYKKFMIVLFMGLFGIVAWGHLLFIISNAISNGSQFGTVSLRFNRYNEMLIEFWLILVILCLYVIFTIYIYKRGID